jgi:hypothetical protein
LSTEALEAEIVRLRAILEQIRERAQDQLDHWVRYHYSDKPTWEIVALARAGLEGGPPPGPESAPETGAEDHPS